MKKTFILNKGSHVRIDLENFDDEQMLLSVCIEQQLPSDSSVSECSLDYFLKRAVLFNLMDEEYKWLPKVSQSQKALWVEICCEKLNIANKWAFAKKMWGLDNLKQYRNRSINEFGKVNDDDIIERCFK